MYHPPPEPPPIPSIVHPLPCKVSEESNSKQNLDLRNSCKPRSFTSDEDYEDREGENDHAISISDGESENYYAGIYYHLKMKCFKHKEGNWINISSILLLCIILPKAIHQ